MERVLFAHRELPPLPPDVAQDPSDYAQWSRQREARRIRSAHKTDHGTLHLVMVLEGRALGDLGLTLEGLRRQLTDSWRLTLLTTPADAEDVEDAVRRGLPRRLRRRVRVVAERTQPVTTGLVHEHLCGVTEGGVALIHPGDVWSPDAVGLLGSTLSPRGVVYADEDEPTNDPEVRAPRFKPAYSPDFLLSSGYLGRPVAMGWEVAQQLPPLVAGDLADLDHECALAACEVASSVEHIAEVLCHRSAKSMPLTARTPPQGDFIAAALQRRNEPSEVWPAEWGTYRIVRPVSPDRSVSIIIPFRDEPKFLRTCVDSVTATSRGHDVELVLVDNGSSDPELLTLLEVLERRPEVRLVHDPRPFNWAELNNAAARLARGEVLVFLNNDIEAHREGWLSALLGHAIRPDVGAVGARLLYPDRRVQHCGVVVGLIGAAGHPLIGLENDKPGYLQMAVATRECAAVTGACLATGHDVFEQLGGFDEKFGVDLNDVDYCLRADRTGLRTVYEPSAELIHYESPSRGTSGSAGDIVNFIERWRGYISTGDRYFNLHLTRSDASCGMASEHEEERWNEWYATLTAS